jgi:hypothetical protein
MMISVELGWDSKARAFYAAWNGQKLELPADDLVRLKGSAFEAEARFAEGKLQIIRLERSVRNPKLVSADVLLRRGLPTDALAELAPVTEEILQRDPVVQSARGLARASTSDIHGAIADIQAVLTAAELDTSALRYVCETLRALPSEAVHSLLPRLCVRLEGLDAPLALLRELPDSLWTVSNLLHVLRTHAATTAKLPWILEEFLERARRIGASEAQIAEALGPTARAVDAARAEQKEREELAAQHTHNCREAAAEPDSIARMLGLLRDLNEGRAPGLVAAIETAHPDESVDELEELRSDLSVEIASPAAPRDVERLRLLVSEMVGASLPADYEAFLNAVDGFHLCWSGIEVFAAAKVAKEAGRIENPKGVVSACLPFAGDELGEKKVLAVSSGGTHYITELARGKVAPHASARSFSEWLCAFVGRGMSRI